MDEIITAALKAILGQGPFAALGILIVLYFNNKLNKSEIAREDLNKTIIQMNKDKATSDLEIAKSQMALRNVIERLIDRLEISRPQIEQSRLRYDPSKGRDE